jgi:signal transduction histidine kinase
MHVRRSTVLSEPRLQLAIAAGGFVLAVGGGLLLATSDFLVNPVAYGIQTGVMLFGATIAGLVWVRRRPSNRVGPMLLGLALLTAVVPLQGVDSAYLHSVGVLVEPVYFLLAYVVVFAFPQGERIGRAERLILAAITLYFMVGFVPWMFFSPVVPGGAPLAGCDPCPANGLMIADRPTVAAGFGADLSWAVIAMMTATIAVLVYRLVAASRPRRRTLLPVYVPALVLTIPVLGFHGFATGILQLGPQTLSDAGWTIVFARSAMPLGFLLAIAQASLFASGALKRLIGEIGTNPDPARLQQIVTTALDDPSVELVYKVDDAFVDSHGRPVESAVAGDGRATSLVCRQGEPVAAIWHDPALNTDPELVQAATQTVLLALNLQTVTAELVASQARTVAAGDAERRRVQRDLHDGAQQKLVALQIKVALAQESAANNPEVVAQLADVEHGLEEAVRELRDLARGIHPPVLRDFGLRAALESAAQRSMPPAELIADRITRYSPDVETAVYFCCLESLQNVAKHAGPGARARVQVVAQPDELYFEIADDGVGCDSPGRRQSGTGLTNMTERVAALRGTLTIDSSAGRGMQVRGRIPLAAGR